MYIVISIHCFIKCTSKNENAEHNFYKDKESKMLMKMTNRLHNFYERTRNLKIIKNAYVHTHASV